MQARLSRKLLGSGAEWFTGYRIGIGQSAHPKTTMHDCASWLNAGRVIELHGYDHLFSPSVDSVFRSSQLVVGNLECPATEIRVVSTQERDST